MEYHLVPGQRHLDHLEVLGQVRQDPLRDGPSPGHDVVGQQVALQGGVGHQGVGEGGVEVGGQQGAEGGRPGDQDQEIVWGRESER